jgi:hypothetical protein
MSSEYWYSGEPQLNPCHGASKPFHFLIDQIVTTPIHANPFGARFPKIRLDDLVTRAASLGDDALELVDLLLGTAEGTELLSCVSLDMVLCVSGRRTLFLASLRARLSLLFRSNSMTRRS